MRSIDADALLEKAWDADTRIGYVQVVDVGDILDAPTIEPEQRRGKWISDEDGNIYCSVCGRTGVGEFFCEHCGANMKGEEDDN